MTAGFRSVLAFFVGGGCKSLSRGDYAGPRSMLAYWLGGGNFHYLPTPPILPISDLTGGLPTASCGALPDRDDEISRLPRVDRVVGRNGFSSPDDTFRKCAKLVSKLMSKDETPIFRHQELQAEGAPDVTKMAIQDAIGHTHASGEASSTRFAKARRR
jgi:hypothetical protein